MSAAHDLCWSSVADIVRALDLDEVAGADGGPFITLTSEMSPDPVGNVRLFRGAVSLVYVGLGVPMIGLDSHMMFAFTPSTSAVPHFTVDSVNAGEGYAFHLDLIPRVDLGAHLAYMDHCYGPLTELRRSTLAAGGLEPADLSPRQWALMSEWMLANHCDEETFREIRSTVDAYRRHWLGLVESGIPAELHADMGPAELEARDRANRASIFDPDVDRVWERVERLVGEERSEEVRLLLAGAGEQVVS